MANQKALCESDKLCGIVQIEVQCMRLHAHQLRQRLSFLVSGRTAIEAATGFLGLLQDSATVLAKTQQARAKSRMHGHWMHVGQSRPELWNEGEFDIAGSSNVHELFGHTVQRLHDKETRVLAHLFASFLNGVLALVAKLHRLADGNLRLVLRRLKRLPNFQLLVKLDLSRLTVAIDGLDHIALLQSVVGVENHAIGAGTELRCQMECLLITTAFEFEWITTCLFSSAGVVVTHDCCC
mmetsp:Transcript_2103/g.4072  ORF Transcript_2103/g.4072 Transcript_2103/m.4072 type:complete len:238 (+) Transcript_2103:534-1247(+)